eukprot:gnl/TRDRNA2_/TRDRNA2_134906_c1_seq2.p1 gnl/TRDRNA2_/TRDRNA2_134906_c1~~gnl/TRDRNA2_/TRDRNA2_134906_c1_seq2.p1  ORF type:complete len:338 (+),score=40.88 gnl/TRDRNA2_/TRDRNA2_134906_c1_seq2:118-1014(+)
MEAVICDGTRVISGATVCRSSLSDFLSGKELASAISTQLMSAGLGVTLGPMIGSSLISYTGSMYAPFAFSAALAGVMAAADYSAIQETLVPEKRKPASLVNPLSLVKIFTVDKALTGAVCLCGLNFCTEGKNLATLSKLHALHTLKLDPKGMGRLTSLTGLAMLVQQPIMKFVLSAGITAVGFRSIANLCSGLNFAVRGLIPKLWGAYLASIFGWVGTGCSNYNNARAIDLATKAGMGKAEFGGQIANLRALVAVFIPMLYSKVYDIGVARNTGGLCFAAPALIAALTELLGRMLLAK